MKRILRRSSGTLKMVSSLSTGDRLPLAPSPLASCPTGPARSTEVAAGRGRLRAEPGRLAGRGSFTLQ